MYFRPTLLGYIRADLLSTSHDLDDAKTELVAFADREGFTLGTVYVEDGSYVPHAFDALMEEIYRDEAVWAVVVPDLSHLADAEHRAMWNCQNDNYATMSVLVANSGL